MAEEPKKKRDGIVDPVCQDVLAVFETPVYKQNKQKNQQARGLLQAVRQKLDPQKLFLCQFFEILIFHVPIIRIFDGCLDRKIIIV